MPKHNLWLACCLNLMVFFLVLFFQCAIPYPSLVRDTALTNTAENLHLFACSAKQLVQPNWDRGLVISQIPLLPQKVSDLPQVCRCPSIAIELWRLG